MNQQPALFEARDGFGHDRDQGKEEWLTPKYILDALGPFDLDPCASIIRPWPTAARHFTIEDNGLAQWWGGRIWLNPPYGNQTGKWLERLKDHGNGIALIFARTETEDFFKGIWSGADALLFLKKRLRFCYTTGKQAGSSGAPSVLAAYGKNNVEILESCGLQGALVKQWQIKE